MTSTNFSEVELPHPDVTSEQYEEQVDSLIDAFDLLMMSVMETAAELANMSVAEYQAELDEMDSDDEDEDDEDDDDDEDSEVEEDEETTPCNTTDDEDTEPEEDANSIDPNFQVENLQSYENSMEEELPPSGLSQERGRKRTRSRSPPGGTRKRHRSVPFRGRSACYHVGKDDT